MLSFGVSDGSVAQKWRILTIFGGIPRKLLGFKIMFKSLNSKLGASIKKGSVSSCDHQKSKLCAIVVPEGFWVAKSQVQQVKIGRKSCFGNFIPESFWGHSGVILVSFRCHSVVIPGSFQGHSGSFQDHSEVIPIHAF